MSDDGRFAGVPHEMTDKLMALDLTPKETRLVWFFVRYLQGYQMKERIIKTGFILEQTQLSKQRVIEALNSLLEKGIIERRAAWERGEYVYRWNENFFGRTHATRDVKIDPKVTDLATYRKNKGPENRTSKSLKPDSEVLESGPPGTGNRTSKTPNQAPIAASQAPKDSIKEKRYILKKENDVDTSGQTGPTEQLKEMFPQFFRR